MSSNNSKKQIRRKAIDCKLIEESQSNPGYFKYIVTIQEKDGSVHKQPAYGKDMQDAMKRLVRSENTDMIVKVVEKKQRLFVLGLFIICILLPVVGSTIDAGNQRWWLMLPLVAIVIIFAAVELIERTRSKPNHD